MSDICQTEETVEGEEGDWVSRGEGSTFQRGPRCGGYIWHVADLTAPGNQFSQLFHL